MPEPTWVICHHIFQTSLPPPPLTQSYHIKILDFRDLYNFIKFSEPSKIVAVLVSQTDSDFGAVQQISMVASDDLLGRAHVSLGIT